jgi:hypothetical protein
MAAIVPNEKHISDLNQFSLGLQVAQLHIGRYPNDPWECRMARENTMDSVNEIFEKNHNMLHDDEYQILKEIFDGFKRIEIPDESEVAKVERLFETISNMVGKIDEIIKEPLHPQGEPHVAAQPPVENVAAQPPKEEEIERQPPVQPQQPPLEDENEPGLPKK